MCGIMGWYSFVHTLPDKDKITNMFSLLESRGRDASGFAFIRDNNLIVHKNAMKYSEFVKTNECKELVLPTSMILHTRMKTQGSEKNNANNHPLFSKNGIAIVHKKERDAEVDSESILHLLSMKVKGDKIKRLFDKVEGSFAIAMLDKYFPERLVLIKKDNPIDLYYDSKGDILYFCSEREIMQEALSIEKITVRGFNVGEKDFHFYEMHNNYALFINSEGVESYQKNYPSKIKWFERRYHYSNTPEEMIIECPWCFSQTTYYDGNVIHVKLNGPGARTAFFL